MFDFNFDNDTILQALGLENSSSEVKAQVIDGVLESLSVRMRTRIGSLMSAEDYTTFGEVSKQGDAAAKAWLQNRFPDYQQMYEEELNKLIDELGQHADAVVEGSKNL